MSTLNEDINKCTKCTFSQEEYNMPNKAKGTGPLVGYYQKEFKNKIMIVGMNPSHRRFPGIWQAFGGEVRHAGSGQVFIDLLKDLGYLDKVYITNLVKCSTPTNKITEHDVNMCKEFLWREIELVNPPFIVCLGSDVFQKMRDIVDDELRYLHHPSYYSNYHKISRDDYVKEIVKALS